MALSKKDLDLLNARRELTDAARAYAGRYLLDKPSPKVISRLLDAAVAYASLANRVTPRATPTEKGA